MDNQPLTLGSLFDGIGAFPYSASFYGIKTLWASEIMPQAVSVTKRHFPLMEHVGDVTQLDGAKLALVDIISFGSPCQDLSCANTKREGLAGERSGLFYEAIRIIREMREATNGRYPRWAIFENVVGCLNSNRGNDFKAVLEAFTQTEVPFPPSGRWTNAGMVRGRGVDLSWIVYCASRFGVAQRRRRVFLVCDFGGECSGQVLFEPKSLRGYFEAGGTPRQSAAAYAARSADGEVRSNCLTPWDTQQARIFKDDGLSPTLSGADMGGGRRPGGLVCTAGFIAGAGAQANSIGYEEETAPTIKSASCGFQMPTVVCASFMGDSSASSYGIEYCEEGAPTLKPRLSGVPCLCEPTIARTLTARGDSSPCADRGQNIVAIQKPADEAGDILCMATGQPNAETLKDMSVTLTCAHESPIICRHAEEKAPPVVHPAVCGTLMASGAGLSRPACMASETDLCVVEPIPINNKATRYKGGGDTRNGDGAGNGLGVGKPGDPIPTLLAGAQHAVAAVDCRNFKEIDELSATLQTQGGSLHSQNPVRVGYIVRRLTPVECERLMGFPDLWTEKGHDGKLISDTARYAMLGNSICVPCLAYIFQGIIDAERKDSE